jgi:hypothetical protein
MSDAETVWVPQARQGGGYRVYHTDRDCPRLEQADRVREKTTKTIPHRLRECKDCAGDVAEYDRGDSEGHLQSLEEAAKSGFEIRTDGGLEGHTDRQDDRPAFLPPDVEYVECYICGQHIEDLSRVEGLDDSTRRVRPAIQFAELGEAPAAAVSEQFSSRIVFVGRRRSHGWLRTLARPVPPGRASFLLKASPLSPASVFEPCSAATINILEDQE